MYVAEGDTDETAEKKRLRLKERREELIKHRETLDETGRESANAFDKTLLSLSGGALFLSLTFVKDIAKHPTMTSRACLVLGWAPARSPLGIRERITPFLPWRRP